MGRPQINIRLGLNAQDLERGLKNVERKLSRFSNKVNRIGRDLTTNITLPLGAVGAAAVSTFARFDRLEKGLEALTGDAEIAKNQFNALVDAVKDTRTTLDLKEAVGGALQLQAVGLEGEKVINTLKQLGIAATVSGAKSEDIGEVARQLAQSAAKGRLLQQELRIILERIPGLAGVINKEFGTVTAEGIRAAGVSAQEFIERLTKAIEENERFQNVQGGLAKSIETFKVSLQLAGNEIGKNISKSLKLEKRIESLSTGIQKAAATFSKLNDRTKNAIVFIGAAAVAAGPLLLAIGSITKLASLAAGGLAVLTGGLSATAIVTTLLSAKFLIIAGGLVALGAIVSAVAGDWEAFRDRVFNALIAVQNTFARMVNTIIQGIDKIDKFFGGAGNLAESFQFKIVEATDPAPFTNLGEVADKTGRRLKRFFFGLDSFKLAPDNLSLNAIGDTSRDLGKGAGDGKGKAGPKAESFSFFDVPFERVENFKEINEDLLAVQERLKSSFGQISVQAQTMGDDFDATQAKIGVMEAELNSLIEDGLTPSNSAVAFLRDELAKLRAEQDAATASADRLTESQNRLKSIANEVGAAFHRGADLAKRAFEEMRQAQKRLADASEKTAELVQAAEEAKTNAFKVAGQAFLQEVARIIKGYIAQAVVSAVSQFITISGPVGLALAPAVGAAAGALFQGLISGLGIPGFAQGGIVTRPTLALVGEGRESEAILPLSKLNRLMNGAGNGFIADVRIGFDDFIIALKRAEMARSRTTG